jgi:hypothetical protein
MHLKAWTTYELVLEYVAPRSLRAIQASYAGTTIPPTIYYVCDCV